MEIFLTWSIQFYVEQQSRTMKSELSINEHSYVYETLKGSSYSACNLYVYVSAVIFNASV